MASKSLFSRLAAIATDAPGRLLRSVSFPFANGGPSGHSVVEHKKASSHLERGRRYYNKKDYGKAEHHFREAIHADPEYALAHYYLGLVLYKQNFSEEAVTAWNNAAAAAPGTEPALKAQRKISYVKSHMNQVIRDLESNIRRGGNE